jgi:hypothetical protein
VYQRTGLATPGAAELTSDVRAMRILLALGVLLAATGGSCSPPSREPVPGSTDRSGTVAEVNDEDSRRNAIDVDPGLRPQSMDFVDADTGYLMLANCDNGCRGALYVTFDGGRSWRARALPVSGTTQLRLDVVEARTVVLVTGETTDWYVSTDSGRTFASGGKGLPPPTQVQRGVMTGCANAAGCTIQVLVEGRPAPTQPQVRGNLRAAARGGSGPIWAVGASGRTITTARSGDGGRTWQLFGSPLDVADASTLRLDVSPDGADVWLSAGPADNSPAVYVAEAAGWRLVTPGLSPGLAGIASAAGDGVLAIAQAWLSYLYRDGRLVGRGFPQVVRSVRTLRDGTLTVVCGVNDMWLGTGNGADRQWAHVRVDTV